VKDTRPGQTSGEARTDFGGARCCSCEQRTLRGGGTAGTRRTEQHPCPTPTQGRKYGRNHLQMRRKYGIALERAGKQGLPCSRCGKPVVSLTMSWDLHHLDGAGPDVYAGVAHSKCNRATAGSGLANA
jgi:hypothetical protein